MSVSFASKRSNLHFLRTAILSMALAAALAVVSPASAHAEAEAAFNAENQAAMARMMAGMEIKPTGDVDRDFTAMMIPHHQGAIDMAEAELLYGRNERLHRIAQEIVVEQLQEIAAMRLAIGEPTSLTWVTAGANEEQAVGPSRGDHAGGDAAFVTQANAAMDIMMTRMDVKPTGDVDHDFVAMMVPHHQGAIDMAEAELRYGHNSKSKTIAQEIVVDQMEQIALMRLALGEPLPPSKPSPTWTPSGAMQSPSLRASEPK